MRPRSADWRSHNCRSRYKRLAKIHTFGLFVNDLGEVLSRGVGATHSPVPVIVFRIATHFNLQTVGLYVSWRGASTGVRVMIDLTMEGTTL